jgi:hypothetical protein
MARPVKPKVDDLVEMLDLSKLFGRVIEIKSDKEVLIDWADKTPNYRTIESIKDLAITKR